MTMISNSTLRSVAGAALALVFALGFTLAATGPAVAGQVNSAPASVIVHSA